MTLSAEKKYDGFYFKWEGTPKKPNDLKVSRTQLKFVRPSQHGSAVSFCLQFQVKNGHLWRSA